MMAAQIKFVAERLLYRLLRAELLGNNSCVGDAPNLKKNQHDRTSPPLGDCSS